MSNKQTLSIQKKLIRSFSLLFLLVLLLLSIAVYVSFDRSQSKQYQQALQNSARQIAITFDSYFSEAEKLLISTSLNSDMLSAWRSAYVEDSYTAKTARDEIQQIFINVLQARTDIAAIAIFDDVTYLSSDNYKRAGLASDFLLQVWNDYCDTSRMYIQYYPLHTLDYLWRTNQATPEVISMAYPVRDYEHLSKTNDALILFDINYAYVTGLVSKFDGTSANTVLILSEDSSVIYCSDQNYAVGDLISDSYDTAFPDSLYAEASLRSSGWKIIVLQPLSVLHQVSNKILLIILGLFVGMFALVLASIVGISKQIGAPITLLAHEMNNVDLDHHEHLNVPNSNNVPTEISTLYAKYNYMMDRIVSLKMESYEAKIKQTEADYRALQAQINPHFLNNVLQTIQSLALMQKNDEIQFVTTSMGDLLEYTLYAKSDYVTLADEMGYVKGYLNLYRYRLGADFHYTIHVDDELRSYILPRFIFQPLVENAVLHGLRNAEQKELVIEGNIFDDQVFLSVRDNGVGMDAARLQEITEKLEQGVSIDGSIGLCNVNQRIRATYGDAYGLELQSQTGYGTCVTLVLPKDNPLHN